MQLGPASGVDDAAGSGSTTATAQTARVLAGVGAYTAPLAGGPPSPWTSSARTPGTAWETWHRLGRGGRGGGGRPGRQGGWKVGGRW